VQATNRRERRGRGQQDRSEQVDSLSDLPQLVQDGIDLGTFVVKLGNALSQFADLGDESRVVIDDPRYGVGALAARRIQLGGFDQTGFKVDSASHNRPYVTRRPDPKVSSGRRST
tara:strand:+ start:1511 stop:1855 length:345 start_codon:yes stop_codon:yes gene_type:complete